MTEPTMRELRASRTHTADCLVLQKGTFDGPEVCTCWCHDALREWQVPMPSTEPTEVVCPRCGAKGNENCTTMRGNDHAARRRAEIATLNREPHVVREGDARG